MHPDMYELHYAAPTRQDLVVLHQPYTHTASKYAMATMVRSTHIHTHTHTQLCKDGRALQPAAWERMQQPTQADLFDEKHTQG